MSMSSSLIYGYGFPVEGKVPQTVRLRFIRNHIDTLKKIPVERDEDRRDDVAAQFMLALSKYDLDNDLSILLKDIIDEDEAVREYLAYFTIDRDIDYRGGFDIIAAIMTEETGIRFDYEHGQSDECKGEASILLPESMPWLYNDAEKTVTEDGLKAILEKYMKELDLKPDLMDFLAIEYYG